MSVEQNEAIGFNRFGDVGVLRRVPVTDPQPSPGQAIVAVDYASVNPIDVKMRAGVLPIVADGLTICGRDGAGRVVAVGTDVNPLLVGRRVAFMAPRGAGTWVRRLAVAADLLSVIPAGVSTEAAAAIPLVGLTAWHLIAEAGRLPSRARVLINGATGGVGTILTQLATIAGLHVVAVCSAARAVDARRMGAAEIVSYDVPDTWSGIREVDVLFDLVGGEVLGIANRILRRDGFVVRVNARPLTGAPRKDVAMRRVTVVPDAAALSGLLQHVEMGRLTVEIGQVFEFDDFAAAQSAMSAGAKGKILLAISTSARFPAVYE